MLRTARVVTDRLGDFRQHHIDDTTHLSPTILKRRFSAIAGFPVSVQHHTSGHISIQRGTPLMNDARVHAAMNEPPTL